MPLQVDAIPTSPSPEAATAYEQTPRNCYRAGALDPGRGLAGREDDLRKATALTTIQIDLGESKIGHVVFIQLMQRRVDAEAAGMNLLQNRT